MLVRKSRYNSPMLLVMLLTLGLAIEAAVFFVGNYWARRYSPDVPTLGPLLFVLSAAGVYLSSQLLNMAFAIPHMAGASLSLLAAMLAWVGVILVLIWLALVVALALSALAIVPARLALAGVRSARGRPTSAPRPAL